MEQVIHHNQDTFDNTTRDLGFDGLLFNKPQLSDTIDNHDLFDNTTKDFDFGGWQLQYEQLSNADIIFKNELFWTNCFNLICTVLAASGVVLNSVVILSIFRRSLKPNMKLVVSLASADLLAAAFHLIFAFVEVDSPWSNVKQEILNLKTIFPNISIEIAENISPYAELTLYFSTPPRGFLGSILPLLHEPEFQPINAKSLQINTTISENYFTDMIKRITHEIADNFRLSMAGTIIGIYNEDTQSYEPFSRTLFSSMNMSSWTFDTLTTDLEKTLLQKFLSAFYLTPAIAGVLTMLAITACLLVTVTLPLKHHLILSKKRGTILTSTIWVVSLLVPFIVFLNIVHWSQIQFVHDCIKMAHVVYWYVTIAIFLTIATMYSVIIYKITRKRLKSSLGEIHKKKKIGSRATLTALIIIGCFLIYYMPFLWIEVVHALLGFQPSDKNIIWYGLMQVMFVLNTNIDAVIYSLRLSEVVKGLKGRLASLRNASIKAMCRKLSPVKQTVC